MSFWNDYADFVKYHDIWRQKLSSIDKDDDFARWVANQWYDAEVAPRLAKVSIVSCRPEVYIKA